MSWLCCTESSKFWNNFNRSMFLRPISTNFLQMLSFESNQTTGNCQKGNEILLSTFRFWFEVKDHKLTVQILARVYFLSELDPSLLWWGPQYKSIKKHRSLALSNHIASFSATYFIAITPRWLARITKMSLCTKQLLQPISTHYSTNHLKGDA